MTDERQGEERLATARQHLQAGRYADAGRLCDELLAAHPDEVEALHLAGLAKFYQGDADTAVEQLSRALELRPESADILANLGRMQQELGHVETAAACFAAAIDIAADDPELRRWLGQALFRLRDYAGAEAAYRAGLTLMPLSGDLHNDLGFTLRAQGRIDEALAAFRRASELKPGSRAAWNNLATLLQVFGQYRAAAESHRKVLAVDPSVAAVAYQNLMLLMTYSDEFSAADRWATAREFEAACAAPIYARPAPALRNERDPARRLRVGYVSSDLHDHPVAWNLEPILAHRDRAGFDVTLYADVIDPDFMTARLRALADRWRPIDGMSDEQIAAQIRADGIDVLVVLAARLDRNRPVVTAYRSAPVQVSLFDIATSGLRSIDYLIADKLLAPRRGPEQFVERVVRLPSLCIYSPIEDAPAIGSRAGRATTAVTIGLFHNPSKVTDEVLRVWAQILRALPGAKVKVKYRGWFKSAGLQERFRTGLGVDDSRLDWMTDDLPRQKHLALYNDVDVVLDTFPFAGATSTYEALWMGVPVVTLLGDSMVARWSAAILDAVGHPELIARTTEEYVAKAIALATDPDRLRSYKETLRDRVARSAVCDGAARARQIERVFRAAWRRWCAH